MKLMLEKYQRFEFGKCPRVYCQEQYLLPIAEIDVPRKAYAKLYCARCEDIYFPQFSKHSQIDGAYFGSSFPHLFFQRYPSLIPNPIQKKYQPRIFGFKIHPSYKKLLIDSVKEQNDQDNNNDKNNQNIPNK